MYVGTVLRFLVLCLMAASACAQQLPLRYYTQQDGLGNLSIDALVQDRNGYMWVGTENGVFRYNGAEFRRYAQDEGLQGSYVSELLIDQKQRLWVGTTEDLYLRAGKRLLPVLKGGRRLPITAGQHLVSSARDTLLAVSEQHLFRLQEQAGVVTITPYFSPDQVERYAELATIHSVLDDGHDAIWAGCGKALCADGAAGVTVWGAAAGVPADSWLRIVRGADGTLWARGEHRIIALPAGAARFVDRTPPGNVLSKGGVTGTLRFDPDGNLLSGTDRGLAVWRRDHWELFDQQNGLRVGGGICAALVDRDGGMWLATRGLGLIRWKGYGNWENWTSRQGLPDDVVLAFAGDGRQGLHIGTSAGLATLTAGSPPALAASRDAPQQWSSLAYHRDGTLWGATFTGNVLRQHGHGQMQMHASGLPPVLRVLFDRTGRLWLATMGGVWMAPHPERGDRPRRVDEVSAELTHAEVREVCEAGNGALWFLTRHVLWRFDQQRWDSYRLSDENGQAFKAMACGAGGELWLASGVAGVWRAALGPDGFKKSPVVSPVLRDKNVFSLLLDHRGWLWMGSDAGVVVWNGAQWRHFNRQDGLVWDDLDEHALYEAPDGTVWVATSNGASHILHPERLFAPQDVTPVLEEGFLDNSPLPLTSGIVLPWSSGALQFKLASLSFRHRDGLRYSYRLVGLEENWTSTAVATIRYPALAPGQYRFQYRAENAATGARSHVAELAVDVQPPWWQTPAFRLLCGTLGAIALMVAHRLRIRWLLARHAQMEQLVRLRTRELEQRTRQLEFSQEALRLRAMQDGLTKAWNRMAMMEFLELERDKAIRNGGSFLLVLLDLDHFKQINDTHGHAAGDQVLLEVVARLGAAIRSYDKLGRYGGEEFMLLLPDLAHDVGLTRVEALRQAIAERAVAVADDRAIAVTASFGVAVFDPSQQPAIAELLERADAQLYRAKKQGRNRVASMQDDS